MIEYLNTILLSPGAGLAPIATSSTQLCANLNADLLDGLHASAFAVAGHTHPYLPLAGGSVTGKVNSVMAYPGFGFYPGALPTGDASDFWIHEVPSESGINEFRIYHRDASAGAWDIAYILRSDSLYLNGQKFWHSGNDGHGSGLDSDTVDGLHAAAFAAAGHNHPEYLLKAGDTATGSLTVFSSVLSGGSQRNIGLRTHTDSAFGIEIHQGATLATLLHTRGGSAIRFGSYLASATAQNSLVQFGEFGTTGGLVLGAPTGGDKGLGTLNATALYAQNNPVWHTGNDGSGSGLDSDLLDGQQGAYYLTRSNHVGVQPWSTISSTPTTLGGYGITDALASAGAVHRSWGVVETDIDTLIPGTAFGSILDSVNTGHMVVGLRSNDNEDSFAVISRDSGNPTYTRLCFRVTADGRVLVGGNQVWHAGNFDPATKSDTGHLHDGRYLQLSGGTLTGPLTINTLSGTPPLVVSQTAKVVNLNADLLDGFDSTAFLRLAVGGTVGGGTTFAAALIAQTQLDVRAQGGASSAYIATWDGSPQSGSQTLRSRTLAQLKADIGSLPVDPHDHDATYIRRDGGNTVTGNIPFGSVTRQMLNLYSTSYGIGVQSATLYLRTAQDFSVHAGGSHLDGANQAGAGGITLLNISSVGNVARLFGAYDIWHTGNFNPASYVPSSRQIIAGTGLTGGGNLTADRTISANFGTTANTVCAGNRGVPAGGSTGQSLVKVSGTNYDMAWQTPGASGFGPLTLGAWIRLRWSGGSLVLDSSSGLAASGAWTWGGSGSGYGIVKFNPVSATNYFVVPQVYCQGYTAQCAVSPAQIGTDEITVTFTDDVTNTSSDPKLSSIGETTHPAIVILFYMP